MRCGMDCSQPGAVWTNLFDMGSSKDLIIVAGNGAKIKCHRGIVAAQSEVIAAMLSPATGMRESNLGRIELKENSEDGITHLISYLYGKGLSSDDITFTCDVAVELFQLSEKYKFTGLQNSVENLFLHKGGTGLARMTWWVRNLDGHKVLQEYLPWIMKSCCQSEESRICERYLEIQQMDAEEALEFMSELEHLKMVYLR